MEEFVKKLALWHTKTFKPIMTHEELEPIMAALGFAGLPAASGWKEYLYTVRARASPPEHLPRVRLPSPRIDGLHILTYRAFFDAVSFYIGQRDISDHFHVRGLPLHRPHDLPYEKKFRRMNDEGLYVYRDGTLDQATAMAYSDINSNNSSSSDNSISNSSNSKSTNSNGYIGQLVRLKDIIVYTPMREFSGY